MSDSNLSDQPVTNSKILVVVVAFLGWLFAGVHMSITSIAMRTAARDLLESSQRATNPSESNPGKSNSEKSNSEKTQPDGRQERSQDADRAQAQGSVDAAIPEAEVGKWFGWLVSAFLLGAATGGYLF